MTESERTAILVQAADAEDRRQSALLRGDQHGAWRAERIFGQERT
jgi:hypothetical protein